MTNFSLFTDAQLATAQERYRSEFEKAADAGLLNAAEATHTQLVAVTAELERRAA